MKNYDSIYGLSKSQQLLSELSTEIGLDYFVRSQSSQLISTYKEKKANWNEEDSKYIVRSAIFVATKQRYLSNENTNIISMSDILKDFSNVHEFMLKLKDFITTIPLDLNIKSDIQSILTNYAFSYTLFKKFEELWPSDLTEEQKLLKKTGWTVFLLSQINLVQRRSEIIECAYMLVAVIFTVVTCNDIAELEPYRQSEENYLKELSSLIKGQTDQIRVSITHLKTMLDLFVKHNVIRSGTKKFSKFSAKDLEFNYDSLSMEYVYKLLPYEFDLRTLIDTPDNLNKEFWQHCGFFFKSFLEYKANGPSLDSALSQIVFTCRKNYSFEADDLESWMESYVTGHEAGEFPESLSEKLRLAEVSEIVSGKKEKFFALFTKILNESYAVYQTYSETETFIVCLKIFETVFNAKPAELEDVLKKTEASAFEVWKLLKLLTSQKDLPKTLKNHLNELKTLILTSFLWTDSEFLTSLKSVLSSKKDITGPLQQVVFDIFIYSAFVIKELSPGLRISDQVKEEIWKIFKSSLLFESDVFFKKNLHQIIVCSMYGLCKSRNLNVTFNSIVAVFFEASPLSESLFRKIQIDENIGNIIRFYNEDYLKFMKTYLLNQAQTKFKDAAPLGVSNNASSHFLEASFCPNPSRFKNSPSDSPKIPSKRAYKFGDSVTQHDFSLSQLNPGKYRNLLDFNGDDSGMPKKIPKFLSQVIDEIDDKPFDISLDQIPKVEE